MFKIESEKVELKAIYYLCRAWESMELAEKFKDPNRFKEAANLFNNASELFTDSNLKFLAQGNSFFCQALANGSKFDETINIDTKAQLYPKIKVILRSAADSYRKGEFSKATDWALGTSTYFDAAWSMIRADTVPNFEEKKKLLSLGGEFLKSAAEVFIKAGYKNKQEEVLDLLNLIEKEKTIIISALSAITEPEITKSTSGIIAPSCPIETSQSPRLGEIREIAEKSETTFQKVSKKDNLTIFFSYATVDLDFFQIPQISESLKSYREITSILYWEESLTDDIYDYMNINLELCDLFIIFCSENAKKSEPVQMEWKTALKLKKSIIPIFKNEKDIPPLLSTKLGLQFDESNLDGTIERLYQLIIKKLS